MAIIGGNLDLRHAMAQVDLKAMTASVAAHAAVLAAFAMTWSEAVLVEGGTRSALVSIDLAMREGGPGPQAQKAQDAEELREKSTRPPTETPTHKAIAEPQARTDPQPTLPPPTPRAGGGGEGRIGKGTAAATTRPLPTARLIPAQMVVAPPAAPQPRGHEGAAAPQGTGGSGGGRTDMAGNSAVSNFKGRIYQHLLRHRRTNTIGSGEVLVAFTIEADGTAGAISVARGSGSSRFDREALALVRRASPFPRPPDGAAHSFTFAITGQ